MKRGTVPLIGILALISVIAPPASAQLFKTKTKSLTLGRTAVAVNASASLMNDQTNLQVGSRSLPVVFDRTVQGSAYILWTELRADKTLSEELYAGCTDFSLAKELLAQLTAVLDAATVKAVSSPEIQAALNRASIKFPVRFGDNYTGPIPESLVNMAPYYPNWEKAVIEELKTRDLADTLLVQNVYLWGLRKGGSACEGETDDESAERWWWTGNISNFFTTRCAVVVLAVENRMVDVKTGKVKRSYKSQYAYHRPGFPTEKYLADQAALFKSTSRCLVKWQAENVRRKILEIPELEEFTCPDEN